MNNITDFINKINKKVDNLNDELNQNISPHIQKTIIETRLDKIIKSDKFSNEKTYGYFMTTFDRDKNFSPRIVIMDAETKEVIYEFVSADVDFPDLPKVHHLDPIKVYYKENHDEPVAQGTWTDVYRYFGVLEPKSNAPKKVIKI